MRLTRWKKTSLVLGAMLLAIGLVRAQQAAGPVGGPMWGDLDGDGQLTIADARLLLQSIVGIVLPANIQRAGLPNADATPTQIQRGRYLVLSSDCGGCHNRGTDDPNDPNWLAGYMPNTPGQPFLVGTFKTYPANLTPDKETGLGNWTPQDIFNALTIGKDTDGMYLCPPMPWLAWREKSDDELWAIVAYLRSIKPVKNAVPASEGPNPTADGHGDWSSAYANIPPRFLPYPAKNETQ